MAKKICGIYRILNSTNGKSYIGSSVDIKMRWRQHICDLRKRRHHSISLQRAWDKYGEQSFEFIVIEEVDDISILFERETSYIAAENTADGLSGYNQVQFGGSCLGFKHTQETRLKMSESQKKIPLEQRLEYCRSWVGRSHTEETKAKMRASYRPREYSQEERKAISAVHKGKIISEEHKRIVGAVTAERNKTPEMRQKVSAALKGRKFSDEHRAKLSAARKGVAISEAQKQKLREKLKGRVFTDEHKAKIRAALQAKKAAAQAAAMQIQTSPDIPLSAPLAQISSDT